MCSEQVTGKGLDAVVFEVEVHKVCQLGEPARAVEVFLATAALKNALIVDHGYSVRQRLKLISVEIYHPGPAAVSSLVVAIRIAGQGRRWEICQRIERVCPQIHFFNTEQARECDIAWQEARNLHAPQIGLVPTHQLIAAPSPKQPINIGKYQSVGRYRCAALLTQDRTVSRVATQRVLAVRIEVESPVATAEAALGLTCNKGDSMMPMVHTPTAQ